MQFCILGSGSSGNAALIQADNTRILLDMGISARRINGLLKPLGESLAQVDALFITHEHDDHISGMEALKRFPALPVFANAATARAVQQRLDHRPAWRIFETGSRFRFKDFEVECFQIPHDAAEPVGYVFHSGRVDDLISPRRSLAWITDLGHAPQGVRDRIRDVDVLVVESNHCSDMLREDPRRPWSLKQRISGRHGHLSNAATRELLGSLRNPRWQRIFLAHLSSECNSIAAVERALADLGLPLAVVPSGCGTAVYDLLAARELPRFNPSGELLPLGSEQAATAPSG